MLITLLKILLLLKIFEGECTAYKFSQPEHNDVYCAPAIYKIVKKKLILIFDGTTNNDDDHYELCLCNRIQQQSVLEVNDIVLKPELIKKSKNLFVDFSPSIIILISDLSLDLFNVTNLKFMFRSLRSIVFFILMTKDDAFKCNEGVFSYEAKAAVENFLNVLWRKYHMFKVVMELPFVCPQFVIIHKGKKETKETYYNRTIAVAPTNDPKRIKKMLRQDQRKLIEGYPVRLNIYPRFPTSIENCENIHFYAKINLTLTQNLCGMDAFIMEDVIEYFKFNATFPVMNASNNIFGYVRSEDNVVIGSLGNLVRNEFDVSFNSRFMVKYLDDDEIKYLHHISHDSICAVMKVPNYIPLWYYPLGTFDLTALTCLLLVIIFIGAVARFIAIIKKRLGIETTNLAFINYLSTGFFGCMIKPMRASISVLRGVCLITSVIILSIFQGHVNYAYTTMVRDTQMKTIQNLKDYNIQIYTSPPVVRLIGGYEGVPLARSQFHYDRYNNLSDLLVHKNWATLQRKADVIMETLVGNYTDEDGTPLLYIVEECFTNYYVTYITRKDFPFANDLTLLITRLVEAGLPEIYYRWTRNCLRALAKLKYTAQEPRPFYSTTIDEQRIPFSVLLVGYIVSSVVFIIEHLWARRLKSAGVVRGIRQ